MENEQTKMKKLLFPTYPKRFWHWNFVYLSISIQPKVFCVGFALPFTSFSNTNSGQKLMETKVFIYLWKLYEQKFQFGYDYYYCES